MSSCKHQKKGTEVKLKHPLSSRNLEKNSSKQTKRAGRREKNVSSQAYFCKQFKNCLEHIWKSLCATAESREETVNVWASGTSLVPKFHQYCFLRFPIRFHIDLSHVGHGIMPPETHQEELMLLKDLSTFENPVNKSKSPQTSWNKASSECGKTLPSKPSLKKWRCYCHILSLYAQTCWLKHLCGQTLLWVKPVGWVGFNSFSVGGFSPSHTFW